MKSITLPRQPEMSYKLAETFGIVGAILQNSGQFFEEVRAGVDLSGKIKALLIVNAIFLALYGAALGLGHPLQTMSAALKLPVVFMGSLLICIPTLYIFDVLLGSKRSLSQTVVIMLAALAVIATLLFSFVFITVAFRLAINGYQFFNLLNAAFVLIALLVGLIYLERGLRLTMLDDIGYGPRNILLYACWIVMFLLVLCQMAWSLRPFFHYPGAPFLLLAGSNNFFTQIGPAVSGPQY